MNRRRFLGAMLACVAGGGLVWPRAEYAALTIPGVRHLPLNVYIRGPRYKVVMPRFKKDVDEMRTWRMDIRQVLSDNPISKELRRGSS